MNSIGRGMIWRILQQYSAYFVKIVVQTVLARLLLPEEFGMIAAALAFINIAEIFAVSGLGTALVQKKEPDALDYGTVLVASFIFASVLYLIIFFAAPAIALYYEDDSYIKLIRIYGLIIYFQSYSSIQNSFVQKNFKFKNSCIATLVASIISGVIAIVMAYKGAGVWSLVAQSMIFTISVIVIIHFTVEWHPILHFKKDRFIKLFSFSWKVLASSLLGTLLENLYSLTIGKYYSKDTLGYYNRGNTYPGAILGQTRTAIGAVILPVFSKYQDNNKMLHEYVDRMTRVSTLIIFPMAFGLAAIAEPFISVLLTDKWLPCVFFLRLECVFYGVLPISNSLITAMTAKGRSDIGMKAESMKLIATILCLLFLHRFDIKVLCYARLSIAIASIVYIINRANKIVHFSGFDLLKCIYKPLIISCLMGVCVYLVSLLEINMVLLLFVQICVGGITYFIGIYFFMRDEYELLKKKILSRSRFEVK